jgi:hypothetical protein
MSHDMIVNSSGNKGGGHTNSRFPIYQLITAKEMYKAYLKSENSLRTYSSAQHTQEWRLAHKAENE